MGILGALKIAKKFKSLSGEGRLDKKIVKRRLIAMAIIIGLFVTAIVVVIASISTAINRRKQVIAALTALNFYEEPKYDKDGNIIPDFWTFSEGSGTPLGNDETENGGTGGTGTGDTGYSGGITFTDRGSQYRADVVAMVNSALGGSATLKSNGVSPAWLYGVLIREVGQTNFSIYANSDLDSLYSGLVMVNDPCGKGSSCPYHALGISHFEGCTYENGKESGNPYDNYFNVSQSSYDSALVYQKQTYGYAVGHAYGPAQFESVYLYNTFLTAGRYRDENLGFVRPNPLYLPDTVDAFVRLHEYHLKALMKKSSIFSSSDFKGLTQTQQSQILFMCATTRYGVGEGTYDGSAMYNNDIPKQYIAAAKAGVDLAKLTNNTYSGLSVVDNREELKSAAVSKGLLTSGQLSSSGGRAMHGIIALNLGNAEYNQIVTSLNLDGAGGNVPSTPTSEQLILPWRSTDNGKVYISSQFGMRNFNGVVRHRGIDVAGTGNIEMLAVNDVEIMATGFDSKMGNYILMKTTGSDGNKYKVYYMHLASINSGVYVGAVLPKGYVLGKMGATGVGVTGIHLHIQVGPLVNTSDTLTGSYNGVNDFGGYVPPFVALYGNGSNELVKSNIISGKITYDINESATKGFVWRGKNVLDLVIK